VTRGAVLLAAAPIALAASASPARAQSQPEPPKPATIESADGVTVTFSSKDPAMEIFLAHGDVAPDTMPDPFERVGVVPRSLLLAPGTYTVETASATTSTAHRWFVIERGGPVTVEVRPGDAAVKTFGAVFIVLGTVSTILGVVAIVSFTKDDSHFNRFGIGLPLILGGVGVAGLGVGMTALGSTDVDVHVGPKPVRSGALPSLSWRF
jgi:hypothetical protein